MSIISGSSDICHLTENVIIFIIILIIIIITIIIIIISDSFIISDILVQL